MKSAINSLILMSVCVWIVCTIGCQITPRQDFNFGFEKISNKALLPDDWKLWGTGGYSVTIDSTTKHSGKYAVLITSDSKREDKSFGGLGKKIPEIYAGKQVEVRAYMKFQDVTEGEVGLVLRIDGKSGVIKMDNMLQKDIHGTSDWAMYSVQLDLPEKATNIAIGAILSGKGKLWVDDFKVFIDDKDITKTTIKRKTISKADSDQEFDKGSKISTFNTTPSTIENLEILGKVWGFLKYYHPSVAKGDYNWDYELFRVMPKILHSNNKYERKAVLLTWIKSLGKTEIATEKISPGTTVTLSPDVNWINDTVRLGEALTQQLIQIKNAKRSGINYYVELAPNIGNPIFSENPYTIDSNPDAGYRLLSLFRYWNIIQYYYPYKDLTDVKWNTILKFLEANDSLQYRLAVLSLIAKVQDTHANIWGRDTIMENYKGKNYVPLDISFVDNIAIVTDYLQPQLGKNTGLIKGDIVKAINGKPVGSIIKEKLPFTPASNYSTQLRDIATDLLRTNDTSLKITYSRNNILFVKNIPCYSSSKMNINFKFNNESPCINHLSNGIGYLYLGTLKSKDLDEGMTGGLMETKGLIIDLRCYPADHLVFSLGGYLVPSATAFVKFSMGNIQSPGLFTNSQPLTIGDWTLNKKYYRGKVVVLVNENTQSQAEYTAMALRASSKTTIIGSTTAGADGNVSSIYLPGGIYTMISGIGVYYPNGRQTQRIGIIPDIKVKPTIKGIQEGRDELLEKAMEIINKK
jgi:C-terminal processing protease CtpA/Prc